MHRPAALLALLLAALAALPAPAGASRSQISVFQDDRLLTLSGPAVRERALDDLALLGADTVHAIVAWSRIAPAPQARRRPTFDGADPAHYPPAHWDPFDDLVRGAQVRGLSLLLSPSAPIPAWASGCRGAVASLRTCRPSATEFGRFVQALGRRYSGRYADENQGGGLLPRVSRWSVWNEPNQGGWLTPQLVRRDGRLVLESARTYRGLVRAAVRALRASGHRRDDVLLGETAPLGRRSGDPARRPSAPGAFLRAALCLDARGRSLRGRAARALGCGGRFARLAVTGVSHHPYTRGGSRPPTERGGPDEITIASSGRLATILRQGAARGRLPRNLPIHYTEFGFQTNPPDELIGVPPARAAEWLNQADWIAYNDPRVRSVAQYELRDEADISGFQTGLRFFDGTPKPGFDAYRMPIWVSRAGSGRVRVWGQVRPADDTRETVEVQRDGGAGFVTMRRVGIDRRGFLSTTVAAQGGRWRLLWSPRDGGPAVTSRIAAVRAR